VSHLNVKRISAERWRYKLTIYLYCKMLIVSKTLTIVWVQVGHLDRLW